MGDEDWDIKTPSNEGMTKTPELSAVRVIAIAPGSKPLQKAPVPANGLDSLSRANKQMQSDAPACSNCGHIMVRSGTCYKCDNCGTQGGC